MCPLKNSKSQLVSAFENTDSSYNARQRQLRVEEGRSETVAEKPGHPGNYLDIVNSSYEIKVQ